MDEKVVENFSKMNKAARIKFLQMCDDAYYNKDNPFIDDETYDQCVAYFNEVYNEDYRNLGKPSTKLKKYKHEYPVLSLAKIHSEDEYAEAIQNFDYNIVIEPKYDGLTVVYYPDGTLVSRGDGYEGEVLPFANRIPGLPKPLEKPVRMEVFISKSVYNTYFKDNSSNSRNIAAGILRRETYTDDIKFLSYRAYNILGSNNTELEQLVRLKLRGFNTSEFISFKRPAQARAMYGNLKKFIDDLDSPTDGIVIKYNPANGLEKFGTTNKHPNHMIAFKFQTLVKKSVLREIIWTPGRNVLTPVAVFDEVVLGGNKISKASVHNMNIIQKLNLKVGAPVMITLKNEIIPQIIGCESDSCNIVPPATCPYCGKDLELNESQQVVCTNINCKMQIMHSLARLVEKNALNVGGLNKAKLQKIYDKYSNYFKSAFCLFTFTRSCLEDCGFTLYSASQLINNLNAAKQNVNMANFLYACNIPGLGYVFAKKIAAHYNNDFNKFVTDFKEDGKDIDGIGDSLYHSILKNLDSIKDNAKFITFKQVNKEENAIVYHVAITGALSKTRSEYQKIIENKGWIFDSSVTKKTNYLISNSNENSSKLEKAKKYNIPVITEEEFIKLLGD